VVADPDFFGVRPSIGESVDRYQGCADGNPDLFKTTGTTNTTEDPDIYTGISGNPDLRYLRLGETGERKLTRPSCSPDITEVPRLPGTLVSVAFCVCDDQRSLVTHRTKKGVAAVY
jgi:hypothetical protein